MRRPKRFVWTPAHERSWRLWKYADTAGGRAAIGAAVREIDPTLVAFLEAGDAYQRALAAARYGGLSYRDARPIAGRADTGAELLALLILARSDGHGRHTRVTIRGAQEEMYVADAAIGGRLGKLAHDRTHFAFPEEYVVAGHLVAALPVLPRPAAALELPTLPDLLSAGEASYEQLDATTGLVALLTDAGTSDDPSALKRSRQRAIVRMLGGDVVRTVDDVVHLNARIPGVAGPAVQASVLDGGDLRLG